jgi:hypothetical protein
MLGLGPLAAGCSPSPSGSSVPECTPGQAVACPCTTGAVGAQTCQSDGTFAPCICGGPDASNEEAGLDGAADVVPRDATVRDAADAGTVAPGDASMIEDSGNAALDADAATIPPPIQCIPFLGVTVSELSDAGTNGICPNGPAISINLDVTLYSSNTYSCPNCTGSFSYGVNWQTLLQDIENSCTSDFGGGPGCPSTTCFFEYTDPLYCPEIFMNASVQMECTATYPDAGTKSTMIDCGWYPSAS